MVAQASNPSTWEVKAGGESRKPVRAVLRVSGQPEPKWGMSWFLFSCCFNKVHDKSGTEERAYFCSAQRARSNWPHWVHSQERCSECWHPASFLFYKVQDPTQRRVLPTVTVALPVSINIMEITPHRHPKSCYNLDGPHRCALCPGDSAFCQADITSHR